MKTLLIMRHAKAKAQAVGQAERERQLAQRGRRNALEMGELLRREGLEPQRILSSTAVRAVQTACAMAEALGCDDEVTLVDGLYNGGVEDYLDALAGLPDTVESALIVGHNPNLVELLADLTDQTEDLPTGAIAHVQLSLDRWADILTSPEGDLMAVWRPREL